LRVRRPSITVFALKRNGDFMPSPETFDKPYTAAALQFWFWLLYRHARHGWERKGIIRAALQGGAMCETLAEDLCFAFCLEHE
jgi:hypothetical protein